MDIAKFEKFNQLCSEKLPNEINKILQSAKRKKACAIGFITTDDFYGFYLTWNYGNDINEYYNWENGLEPDFLYQPVVDIVEDCNDIDFCVASDKKREFAKTLLSVLKNAITNIPDEIFQNNNFRREDVLFFSTMGSGDYVQDMIDTSLKMFNSSETLKAYGIKQ